MINHLRSAAVFVIIPVAVAAMLSGCGRPRLGFDRGGGQLQITSHLDQRAALRGGFQTGMYRLDGANKLTMLLLDGPPESPSQAVTIRMLWQPRAGHTPVQETATNATVHYVIFTGEADTQVGIYSGAGYFYPQSALDGSPMRGAIWQATLQLDVSSEGFRDLLGSAILKGNVKAQRDDLRTSRTLRRIHERVHATLGYPRQVQGESTTPSPSASYRKADTADTADADGATG